MRLHRLLPTGLLVGAVALAACDADPLGVQIADFEGTWTASQIVYTAQADQTRQIDIAHQQVGGGLSLNIGPTGNYSGTLTLPTPDGPQPIPITGSVTLVSDTEADIVFNWPTPELQEDPPITDFRATFTLAGDNLTFTRTGAMFHFWMFDQPAPELSDLLILMSRS